MTSKTAANPINPCGIRRGIAKPDVYRLLERWERDGLREIEATALEAELGWRPPIGERPSLQVQAQALLLELRFREWIARELGERWRAIDELELELEGDVAEEFFRAEEQEEAKDVCRWAAVVLATSGSDADPELLRRLEAGEIVDLPAKLERRALTLLRRERRRWREGSSGKWGTPSFHRQLGRLPDQEPHDRERTVADWRRNARRASPRGSGAFPGESKVE